MILRFGLDNIHSRVKKTEKKVFALISFTNLQIVSSINKP